MKASPGRPALVAMTALAPVVWGTTYLTITELLPDGRPLLVAALRVLPAGLVLLGVAVVMSRWQRDGGAGSGSRPSSWRPRGTGWWHTGVLATTTFAVFFPLLAVAVYRLPGGVAAAAGGLQPLLVTALSAVLVRRRAGALEVAVGVTAALGVGLVVLDPGAGLDPVGVLAAVAANVSFATGVVLTRRFPQPCDRVAATAWQLLISGVVLLPLALLVEGRPPSPTGTNLAGFAYLSLAGTAIAFLLWSEGIRRLPVAAPPLLGLAAPVTGVALGWAVLSQDLRPVQLVGFALTLAAIGYGARLHERTAGGPAAAGSPGVRRRPQSPQARPRSANP